MLKSGGKSPIETQIKEVLHLLDVLGTYIKKFEETYERRDPIRFNQIKRELLQIQRRILGLLR